MRRITIEDVAPTWADEWVKSLEDHDEVKRLAAPVAASIARHLVMTGGGGMMVDEGPIADAVAAFAKQYAERENAFLWKVIKGLQFFAVRDGDYIQFGSGTLVKQDEPELFQFLCDDSEPVGVLLDFPDKECEEAATHIFGESSPFGEELRAAKKAAWGLGAKWGYLRAQQALKGDVSDV